MFPDYCFDAILVMHFVMACRKQTRDVIQSNCVLSVHFKNPLVASWWLVPAVGTFAGIRNPASSSCQFVDEHSAMDTVDEKECHPQLVSGHAASVSTLF